MLNPTLHVLLVSAQAADMGQYITLGFTTALRLQHNCRAQSPDKPDAGTVQETEALRLVDPVGRTGNIDSIQPQTPGTLPCTPSIT